MTCKDCLHYMACKTLLESQGYVVDGDGLDADTRCETFQNKADFAEIVRCKDCLYASEFDKHCELNRNAYRHCELWKGDETRNVWHKYKKYYRDYSIIEADEFCSSGVRREE